MSCPRRTSAEPSIFNVDDTDLLQLFADDPDAEQARVNSTQEDMVASPSELVSTGGPMSVTGAATSEDLLFRRLLAFSELISKAAS